MAKYKLQELNDMRDEGKRRVYPKMVTTVHYPEKSSSR